MGGGAPSGAGARSGPEVSGRRRVVLTFADQVVSSASNFITGVAVARVSGAVAFGEYALVLTIWIVVVGTHRRIITEPMIVGSKDADTEATPIAHGLSSEVLLGLAASAVTALGGLVALGLGADIGVMLLALAPWFAPLLVQDYWRAIAYQRRRPDLALVNDVVFAVVQVVAIVALSVLGLRSGGHMLVAWGLGATAGAVLGARWFPARAGWRDGWRLLGRLWPRGRWLFADYATAFVSQQGYLVFAALLLTKVDYGGFRAAFSLLGPTMVILLAAGNIGLPEAVRRASSPDPAELRRYVIQLSFWVSCCVALYGVALAIGARPLLRELYGQEFVRFAPLTILVALEYLVLVFMYGQGIAVRATGWVSRLWPARIVIAVSSLVSLVVLERWLGLSGVAWAGVATGAYDSIAVYLVYRWGTRTDAAGRSDAPPLLPTQAGPALESTILPPDGATT